jgi:hypothetical protein
MPTVRDRPIAAKRDVVPRKPGGDPRRIAGALPFPIQDIRTLTSLKGRARVVEPPRGRRQALKRFGTLLAVKRLLEATTSFLPGTPIERFMTRHQQVGLRRERVGTFHGSLRQTILPVGRRRHHSLPASGFWSSRSAALRRFC